MRKKLALVASFAVAVALTVQFGLSSAYAAAGHKVDCTQVMTSLQGGKKVADVAKEMKISKSSVYRCRKAAKKEAATKSTTSESMGSPAAKASPAAAPAAH